MDMRGKIKEHAFALSYDFHVYLRPLSSHFIRVFSFISMDCLHCLLIIKSFARNQTILTRFGKLGKHEIGHQINVVLTAS